MGRLQGLYAGLGRVNLLSGNLFGCLFVNVCFSAPL